MFKGKGLASLGIIGMLVLLFLLVRENEGRTQAVSKLKSLEDSYQALRNEKQTAVMGFQEEIDRLKEELRLADEKFKLFELDRNAERDSYETRLDEWEERFNVQAEEHTKAIAAKDSELKMLRDTLKSQADKYEEDILRKSAEVKSASEELRSITTKYAEVVSKKEELNARTISLEKELLSAKTAPVIPAQTSSVTVSTPYSDTGDTHL